MLSIYWVAVGYLWQSLGVLVIPALVQQMVGDAHKGTALAVLEGIGTLMAVVWQPLVGAFSDRVRTPWGRRRPFIAIGTLGDAVFLVGLALSGSYLPLLVFYFLLQAASNTAQGPYQGLLPDVVPEAQRGQASGYYGLANLLGILFGTVGAGLIHAHFGAPAAVLSAAVFLVVTAAVTLVAVREPHLPPAAEPVSALGLVRATFTTPLANRDFCWLMASRLLVLMGVVGIQSFALYFFTDTYFGHDRTRAVSATTVLLGTVIVVGILCTWPAAWLSNRTGRRPMVAAGGLLGAAGTLLLVFSNRLTLGDGMAHLPLSVTVSGLLVGTGFGCFISVDWAFITDVIPRSQAGLFMGFSNIATAGSGIIARFVGGILLDHFNAGPPILGLPGGYPVIFLVFFSWLVLGSGAVFKVRGSRRRVHTSSQ